MKTQMINKDSYTRNQQPGKFEGERPETEYFWEQLGEGEMIYLFDGTDQEVMDDEPCAEIFKVNAEEAEAFGLSVGAWFLLMENDQGFVSGSVHGSREEAEKEFRAWHGVE